MTAAESRRPGVSRKSLTVQLLFAVVLLLIARFLWLRDRPERLTNAPDWVYTISGDYLYTEDRYPTEAPIPAVDQSSSDKKETTIQAQSIYGGDLRVIAREDAHYQFRNFSTPTNIRIAEGEIYYFIEPRPKGTFAVSGMTGAPAAVGTAPIPPTFLGTFLTPKNLTGMETAGQKRVHYSLTSFPAMDIRVRQVSIRGGTSRDAAAFRSAGDSLVGNHLFWIRPGPGEWVEVTQEKGKGSWTSWREVTADSDLMLTSLADGVTRTIFHGIPRYTSLFAGEAGVTWEEPAPFPGRSTVFYARVSDGSVHALGAPPQINYPLPSVVEAGGQLFWAVTPVQSSPYTTTTLMSANLDGTNIREVCTQVNRHPIGDLSLHAYQGNLYCFLGELRTAAEAPSKHNLYLCRFHPERSDPMEIVHKLPNMSRSYQFDGGYLYFVWNEEKRSLWASLTNDEAGTMVNPMLCRVPVDH